MSIAEKFEIIADAVYEKGKKDVYDAFWDGFQNNGNRTSYKYAFAGAGWTAETLKPKYEIIFPTESSATYPRNCAGMFAYLNISKNMTNGEDTMFDMSELLSKIDFSNCKSAQNLFQNARVQNITCDFSNCLKLDRTFDGSDGGQFENITIKVTEKCTSYSAAFNYCKAAEIHFTNDSIIAATISFAQDQSLSETSIASIIQALETTSTTKTLTLHADALAKVTDEQKATIATKGWTLSQA